MHETPTASERVIPPVPMPLPEGLSTQAMIRAYAINVLATYPERAFEDEVVVRRFYGRLSFPDQRARGHPPRARRQRCSLRADASDHPHPPPTAGRRLVSCARRELARAAPGDGPRLRTEGRAAFAGATVRAFTDAHARLSLDGDAILVDLVAWLQHLALDVASRALFSMPIGAFGVRLRLRHSALGFLDFFLLGPEPAGSRAALGPVALDA